MKNKIFYIVLSVILFLAVAIRFYSLSNIPMGLQQDETSIGYNAYSILETGRDEYGKSFPLNFKAFGEYKLPFSIYLTSASIKLFGLNEFAVRFPFALFGVLTVFVLFLLVYELFGKKELALVSAFLLAINPWHIHFSRGAYEVIPALFFITLGVFMFVYSLKRKNLLWMTLGLSSLVLSMYSYNIARLFIPLFVLFLFITYSTKGFKTRSIKELSVFILPLILLIPFVTSLFSEGGFESARGQLITSSAYVEAQNLEMRSYVLDKSPIAAKLFFNNIALTKLYYVKNVLSYFNSDFLFVKGSLHGNHGIGNVGQFHYFEIATITIGLFILLKKKSRWRKLLLGWILGVILVASLTREAPHATRSFFMVVPLVILSSVGLIEILNFIYSKKSTVRYVAAIVVFGVISYAIIFYLFSYFVRFPLLYGKSFRSEDKAVSLFLAENYNSYDSIIIDPKSDLLYTSIIFYTKFSPRAFYTTAKRAEDDSEGFSKVLSFGKYKYEDPLIVKSDGEKILFISNKELPGFKVVKKFYYPTRPVVISEGQNILGFPTTEEAYVLLEKN